MTTQWHDLGNGAYILLGGSNIGAIVAGKRAVLIDAGLDRDAAKKAVRALEGIQARPEALIITHGHADHFGGAGWLAQRGGVALYAPPLESVFAVHPRLEPLFLYGGAAPIAELQGKFTLAREAAPACAPLTPGPMRLMELELELIPLFGHAPEQMGVGYGETCYCGDALFPAETLARHPILFCADLDAWLETLTRLPTLGYTRFAPGHGEPLADAAPLAAANAARLREIRALTWEALRTPQTPAEALRAVATRYGVIFAAPQFFLLALTTIHAALSSLQRAGEAMIVMDDNRLLWQRV